MDRERGRRVFVVFTALVSPLSPLQSACAALHIPKRCAHWLYNPNTFISSTNSSLIQAVLSLC